MKLSYSVTCALRPLWALPATTKDLQTCLCKQHENVQSMAEKLSTIWIIPTVQIEELAASLSCDPSVNVCRYRECENCKHDTNEIAVPYDSEDLVKRLQWKTTADENGYTITVKETKTQTLQEMLETFQQPMESLCRQVFNSRHQYREDTSKCDSLEKDECIIHIDLTDNYICRYTKRIQTVHFGGSHREVTMHTGVVHIPGSKGLQSCTISHSQQ